MRALALPLLLAAGMAAGQEARGPFTLAPGRADMLLPQGEGLYGEEAARDRAALSEMRAALYDDPRDTRRGPAEAPQIVAFLPPECAECEAYVESLVAEGFGVILKTWDIGKADDTSALARRLEFTQAPAFVAGTTMLQGMIPAPLLHRYF